MVTRCGGDRGLEIVGRVDGGGVGVRRCSGGVELGELFEELREIALRGGVEVRVEGYGGAFPDGKAARGGLCTVRGRRRVVVDSAAGVAERIAVLAEAIGVLGLDLGDASPQARATIGAHARPRPQAPGPRRTRPQPLARTRKRKAD